MIGAAAVIVLDRSYSVVAAVKETQTYPKNVLAVSP